MDRTKHNMNFSETKSETTQIKMHQQIYNPQSQVQHIHAYLRPANNRSIVQYGYEKAEK
jgi:hypothetical protein